MGSRAAAAVLASSVVVGAYAAWRAFTDQQRAANDNPQWIYAPYRETGGAKAKLASLQGGDGSGQIVGGGQQDAKTALVNWGVETLFSALDGKRVSDAWDGLFDGGEAANDDAAPEAGRATWLDGIAAGLSGGMGGLVSLATGGTKGLRDFIGQLESRGDYNAVYGGSRIQPPRPITTMTVREVLAWQDRSVAAGSASSAAGKYQIIRGTLRGLVSRGVVRLDEVFSPEVQDRCADALLRQRGLDDYRAGRITAAKFADNLAKEWASLPAILRDKRGRPAQGQSYYAGDGLNRALTTRAAVLAQVKRVA